MSDEDGFAVVAREGDEEHVVMLVDSRAEGEAIVAGMRNGRRYVDLRPYQPSNLG